MEVEAEAEAEAGEEAEAEAEEAEAEEEARSPSRAGRETLRAFAAEIEAATGRGARAGRGESVARDRR